MKKLGAACLLSLTFAACTITGPGPEYPPVTAVELVGGLSRPWSLAFLPDGDMLVTERTGALLRIHGVSVTTIANVPEVNVVGQGGLLDVVLDPDFAENRTIYLSYAAAYGGGTGLRVSSARVDGDALMDVAVIFESNTVSSGGSHFGGRMVIDANGYLYITHGDRGDRSHGQNTATHAGSVLRITTDGAVPVGNPFVGEAGYAPELFTYGHRNPQGMVIDRYSGTMWLHEHGPLGGDEVNILLPGRNYGWADITYGTEYGSGAPIGEGTTREDVEPPVVYYVPTSIAPSGMVFYHGGAFPEWRGDLFIGTLAGQHLRRLILDDGEVTDQEVLLEGQIGRIRDVREGPDGHLYLITDSESGSLFRVDRAE